MSEAPNIKIEEANDEEIINEELNAQYEAENLIEQNKELLKKLALAENPTSIERPKKGFKKNGEPRKKAEMTDKRKEAIKKMREGRAKWLEEKKKEKEVAKQNKVEKPKKQVKPKKQPELIESSSEEEIIEKPKPKPKKKKKKVKKYI